MGYEELSDHVLVFALVDGAGGVGEAQGGEGGGVGQQLQLELVQLLDSLLLLIVQLEISSRTETLKALLWTICLGTARVSGEVREHARTRTTGVQQDKLYLSVTFVGLDGEEVLVHGEDVGDFVFAERGGEETEALWVLFEGKDSVVAADVLRELHCFVPGSSASIDYVETASSPPLFHSCQQQHCRKSAAYALHDTGR